LAWSAFAADPIATVWTTIFALTKGHARRDALPGHVTDVPGTADTTLARATIGTAILVGAIRRAIGLALVADAIEIRGAITAKEPAGVETAIEPLTSKLAIEALPVHGAIVVGEALATFGAATVRTASLALAIGLTYGDADSGG
jgi:hypothetical protein